MIQGVTEEFQYDMHIDREYPPLTQLSPTPAPVPRAEPMDVDSIPNVLPTVDVDKTVSILPFFSLPVILRL